MLECGGLRGERIDSRKGKMASESESHISKGEKQSKAVVGR